jgi:serine/threonine-protein kinase
MSVVFAAEHTVLRQPVAIKFLNLEHCESAREVARFLQEGRSAARIRSERVTKILDVDIFSGGVPYIVMEYLEGQDLADLLRQRRTLSIPRSVDYVMQALEAVAEAHTLNIVHRDLKPSNLFLVRRSDGKRDIKVIDFGISKSLGGSEETALTRQGSILGSPEYMSPEQVESSRNVDARTDLWSLGVVLYELIVGRPPFQGATFVDVLTKVAEGDPPDLLTNCPGAAPELAAVIRRCLERRREYRYQNAGELASALLPFGSERARLSYDSIMGVIEVARDGRPSSSLTTDWQGSTSDYGDATTVDAPPLLSTMRVDAPERRIDREASRPTIEETMVSPDPITIAEGRQAVNDDASSPAIAKPRAQPVKARRPLMEFVAPSPVEMAATARKRSLRARRRSEEEPNIYRRLPEDTWGRVLRRGYKFLRRRDVLLAVGAIIVALAAAALLRLR